jgi:indolepyruvate ferredoxin oxidoreductase
MTASQNTVSLSDRFTLTSGRVLLTGVQALVRLVLDQAMLDRTAGIRSGGFVSGYRGSPLGTLDLAFQRARGEVEKAGIVVMPAVNEELAATAIAGSQQIEQTRGARVEGIFSLWYGKGPGLDRASDAVRHGNVQGASPKGGVVLAIGDDHLAKSSSITCCSDQVAAGLSLPLFSPADAEEVIRYGLHGFAVSRLTGSWTALKIVPDMADATFSVEIGKEFKPILPEIVSPAFGLHNRWPEMPLEQEQRQKHFRLPAVAAYVRANKLDVSWGKTRNARIGLVAAGKSWMDLLEALRLLEISDARLEELKIALYKPALVWPLETEGLREFSAGLEVLVVMEEKDAFIESQAKEILYGTTGAPAIYGKRGPDGTPLFEATGGLEPEKIAAMIGQIVSARSSDVLIGAAVDHIRTLLAEQQRHAIPPAVRKPFFCSGCPHNRSTVLPTGSRATSGIGCHGLAAYNRPAHSSFAQMGGEGVHWMGLMPFTDEAHVFANMGDGTYFHSGLLAIRQAVAARLNITYKLLYNSAVAMTGGQPVDGELSVDLLIDQLRAEGVHTVTVATDDPERYPPGGSVRRKTDRLVHRDDLEVLQRAMREQSGVSVIIYEQMCATELRRLRKRGKLEEPATRMFVNPLVCEGCGDCSTKSNCLSVEPVETPFGTKRAINQSSCNKDYSCLSGFCPSFVSVEGARVRKPRLASIEDWAATMPMPADLTLPKHQRIVVAGIGGTGIVTISALLAMANHSQGRQAAVLDQVGMAQKGGSVLSHIHLADEPITALRIPVHQADVVLACDEVVGNLRDVMSAICPGKTFVLGNADVGITGDFTQNRSAVPDATLLARRLQQRAKTSHFIAHPFTRLSTQLLGDAIGSNLMMLGYAWQKGWIRVDLRALQAAIELNGVAVAMNKAAVAWGRRLVVDPTSVYETAGLTVAQSETLNSLIETRAAFLADYQDQAYADRFRATIAKIRLAEARISPNTALTEAVARSLFKLMAYKDEYEVARLFTDISFTQTLEAQFEGWTKLNFHMAPPILARRDKTSGHLRKRRFGRGTMTIFRVLAKLKKLRGTRLDPFGQTSERRSERRLIVEFEELLTQLGSRLTPDNLACAVAVAMLPQEVKGYGHIKAQALEGYQESLAIALLEFEAVPAPQSDERKLGNASH